MTDPAMSPVPPSPPDAPGPEPLPAASSVPAPAGSAAAPGRPPKSRRWFVILAWVTLVGFALFVAGITAVTAALPMIRRAHEASR